MFYPRGRSLSIDAISLPRSAAPSAADAASLRLALLVLAPTGFWATWHFLVAARTVVEDQKRAIGYTTA